MRIIQSFNSDSIINIHKDHNSFRKANKFKEMMNMAVLSHLYLKEFYDSPLLLVDKFSYQFFKEVPFLNVEILDDYIPLNKTNIWTQSKIAIINRFKEPIIHIDFDILIKKHIPLNFEKILVERIEDNNTFKWYESGIEWINEFVKRENELAYSDDYLKYINKYWSNDKQFAYNTGVFGFKDPDIKDRYCDFYFELENLYSFNLQKKEYHFQIFIVLEQYALKCFTDVEKISVNTVLEGDTTPISSKYADDIGYCHLFGHVKYKPENENLICKILSEKYTEVWQSIKEILRKKQKLITNV